MKILTGKQIREADRYTIEHEPVGSQELMERASEVIAQWICNHIGQETPLFFFIGKGNNGGDGLAVARMLYHAGYSCYVYLIYGKELLSAECRFNLERLPEGVCRQEGGIVQELDIPGDAVVIDAILGTGVTGPLKDPVLSVVEMINFLPNRVVSIDLPSGLGTEFGNDGRLTVMAETTLTLEFPKLAMLMPEAGDACGRIEVLAIDLDARYMDATPSPYYYVTEEVVRAQLLSRPKFGHKGTFGHVLLVCGSEGMMGAGILAAAAALRSGCGLVTLHLPIAERMAVQVSSPSALLSLDPGTCFSVLPGDLTRYASIGIGCGMGQAEETVAAFETLLRTYSRPVVLDADALNILASNPRLREYVPEESILTPHPGELRRLVGEWDDEEQKLELVKKLAADLRSVVVVKGAHSMICSPEGVCWFNSSGCAGLAKGGSGDVLAGLLAGLLARGYDSMAAAVVGVYIHGLAGEKCAAYYGEESMNSGDLPDFLAEAFMDIR